MLSVLCALLQMFGMCFVKVCLMSRLRLRILLLFVVQMVSLSIGKLSWVSCSCVSGVASVICVLLGLILSLLCLA